MDNLLDQIAERKGTSQPWDCAHMSNEDFAE